MNENENNVKMENTCQSCEPEQSPDEMSYMNILRELQALEDKIQRLNTFIMYNTKYKSLSTSQQELLRQQLVVMIDYATILHKRRLLWS